MLTTSNGGGNPRPSNVVVTTELELPEALRPGGAVEAMLLRSRDEARRRDGAYKLHEAITADLQTLQNAYRRFALSSTPPSTPPQLPYAQALLNPHQADPVFRCALARSEGMDEVSSRWADSAWQAYLKQPAAYDAVLGDFIPEDFWQNANEHLAQKAYDEDTNLSACDDWDVYDRRRAARSQGTLLGLSTGLPSVDAALRGLRGQVLLGGAPGVGKTTLALQLGVASLRAHPDLAVVFLSLDMPKHVIYDRLLCHESGVDYFTMMSAPDGEVGCRLEETRDRLKEDILRRLLVIPRSPQHVRFRTKDKTLIEHTCEFLQLERVVKFIEDTGAPQRMFIIDHLQRIDVPIDVRGEREADHYRTRLLEVFQLHWRSTAQPAGPALLVISELRKDAGPTGLVVADLLGSADIGYSAESILLLEPARTAGASGDIAPVVLRVAKGRDGARRTEINLLFDFTRCRFREADTTPSRSNLPSTRNGVGISSQIRRADPFAGLKEE